MNFFPSEKITFQSSGLDLSPMTLTFTNDLNMVKADHHTKFGGPVSNGSLCIMPIGPYDVSRPRLSAPITFSQLEP